jgi:riboflavin synthase alpha subunit
MFTGIIERQGSVRSVAPTPDGLRIEIDAAGWPPSPQTGESISVDGCCLTLVDVASGAMRFDAIPQTLARTTLGALRPGDAVNLERSLAFGAPVGGHLVQGHVECVGTVIGVSRDGGEWRTRVGVPADTLDLVVERGSVAVDGVSLTVAARGDVWFEVALIPETLSRTTLRGRLEGARVNVEPDAMARMVAAEVRRQVAALGQRAGR